MTDSDLVGRPEPVSEEAGFVLPPSWQGLRHQVVYLAQFGGGIQVVVGVAGAGKTTFARWLSEDEQALPLAFMRVPPGANAQQIIHELLLQIGLRPPESATLGELLVTLRSYVQSLHRDGSRMVVLVDDAHLIADSELAALVSVIQGEGESGVGLHFIFMAEPGLVERLDRLQLLDVEVHDAGLPAMSPSEIAALLEKSDLLPANASGQAETNSAHTLWSRSRGIPGRALAMARSSSVSHAPKSPQPPVIGPRRTGDESAAPLRGWPIAHCVALILLCCVLIWAFFIQKNTPEPVVETIDIRGLPEEPAGRQVAASPSEVDPQSPPSLRGPVASRPIISDAQRPYSDTAEPTAAPVGLPQEEAPESGAQNQQPLAQRGQDSASGEQGSVDASAPAEATVAPSESDDGLKQLQEPPQRQPQKEPQQQSASASAPAKEKDSAALKPAPSKRSAIDLVKQGEAQLLASPGNAYVLQLMASSDLKTLVEFFELQPNRDNLLVYRAERGGKLLYILVEGFYADKSAASAAISNLPANQRKGGPWPKRISQIHQDINENRRR